MSISSFCTNQGGGLAGNYLLGTFSLEVRDLASSAYWNIGNIVVGSFAHTPTVIEHRRGTDNSLDGTFVMGKDYVINFTADEVTAWNIAMMLNETPMTMSASGTGSIIIKLEGKKSFREYAVRLIHNFSAGDTDMYIEIPRASIMSEWSLEFNRDNFGGFTGQIRALKCSNHGLTDFGDYGRVVFYRVQTGTTNISGGETWEWE